MTRPLNPFDTGTRLEPQPWVRMAGGVWWAGSTEEGSLRRADADDFGRVDFDDDEGATIAVVYIRKDVAEDGTEEYVLVIDEVQDVIPIRVEGPQ